MSFGLKKGLHTLATGWKERLGWWPPEVRRRLGAKSPFLWAHAASVGEATLTVRLLQELRPHLPWPFLVTTVTPQGRSVAAPKVEEALLAPVDIRPVVRRFFDAIKPKGVLVAETELWPNLLGEASRRGVPTVLFNARISERTFRRYLTFRPLFRRVLRSFTLLLARTEEDARRLLRLGAPPERTRVLGELKLYQPPESSLALESLRRELGLTQGDRLIVAGSTHPGEEEMVLEVFTGLKGGFPRLKLLLAPRHVERAKEVLQLAQGHDLKASLRTQRSGGWEVLVLDTTGELRDLYGLAEVAFVGGSLVEGIGGHNLLEPLAHGRPVVFGPYVANFRAVAERIARDRVGIQVKGAEELTEALRSLLRDPEGAREMGRRALPLLEEGRRAMQQTVKAVLEALGCTPGTTP